MNVCNLNLARRMGACAFVALLASLVSSGARAAAREEISLNGAWQMLKVTSLATPPPGDGWRDFAVPGVLRGHDYERAWFRRSFVVPESWQGKRVFVRFGGVKYNSRVFVNDQEVGGCFNGYDAFALDITGAVRAGEENVVRVGVHDWTGIFTDEPVDFGDPQNRNALRHIPRDRILGPIGGHVDMYGIWDDVSVSATPPVHLTDLFVRPSIRLERIEMDVRVVNAGSTPLEDRVEACIYPYDGSPRDAAGAWPVAGEPVAVVPAVRVDVEPGEQQAVTVVVDNPPIEPWWPHMPTLYVLELRLGDEGDRMRERIGFREFWCEGGDFYLNGAKVHLLATSWWPPLTRPTREEVVSRFQAVKRMNAFCFRTHTQPWHRIWYEVADELGVLMIPEGAIWNDDSVYRVEDPRFWDNYAAHLTAMVRNLGNHPSVVMWSLENEFQGGRVVDDTPAENELARMGRVVKEADPTRPITYESDGDPGGVADVIGLHYPNEYPARRLWPNDAYWMDEPSTSWRHNMFWDEEAFLWERVKPLYIGEFLWAPARNPSTDTLFFGDAAYKDFRASHNEAKALSWRMQILAYRHYEVSGISPWTVIEHGKLDETNPCWVAQRALYRPLAAFIREHDSRFFAGESVARTVDVFNDTMTDEPGVVLAWRLVDGEHVVAEDDRRLDLPAGAHEELELDVPMPLVTERKRFALRLTLHAKGEERFREEWPTAVFPRLEWGAMPEVPLALCDPQGVLRSAWERAGAAFQSLDDVDAWDGDGILVIGPGALASNSEPPPVPIIGSDEEGGKGLHRKVREGGRVLVLEQTEAASDWLPVRLTRQASTMAFPQAPNHPILRGIPPEDLRWWRGDHRVSAAEPARPILGPGRALIVTGTAQGISHAPLLEIPQGDGAWLMCQLAVVSKLDTEPVAHILLERMLAYLADRARPKGHTVCLGPAQLQAQLDGLNIDWRALGGPGDLRWPDVQLAVMQGAIAGQAQELTAFLDAGGNVLWHRPAPDDFASVYEALHLPTGMQPYRGPVLRAEGDSDLLEAPAREDLYWLGEHEGWAWSATPLAHDMAEAIFAPALDLSRGQSFEAELEVELEGKYVAVRGEEVAFSTVGNASWNITIAKSGPHLLGLVARGTPVEDVYPTVEARLDDRRLGTLYIGSRDGQAFTLAFDAERGAHRLSVAFTNDLTSPTEDRNFYLDKVAVSPCPEAGMFEALTRPAALVRVPVGKGCLVLNAVRWDEPGRNTLKAQRFIGSLLGALGARFRGRGPVSIIEAETLTPQRGIAHFRAEPGHAYLGSTGYIEGPVNVATAGAYRIALWARGTDAEGVYPIVALSLNDQELGRVECTGETWGVHAILADLPEGEATLRVAFTNDFYQPPDDRNLWIDRIEFEQSAGDD